MIDVVSCHLFYPHVSLPELNRLLETSYAAMETPLDLDNPGGSPRGDVTPSLHSLPADGSTVSGGVHTNSAGVSNVAMHGNDRSNERVTNDAFSQVPASPTNDERILTDAEPSSDVHAYVDNTPSSLEIQYPNKEDINIDSFRLHAVADDNTLSGMSDENEGDFDGLWEYLNPVFSPFGNLIGSVSAQGFDSSSETPFLEKHVGDTDVESLHESMLYFDPALHDNAVFDMHDNPGGRPALNDFIDSDWPDGGGDVMTEHGQVSDSRGPGDNLTPDGSDAVEGVKSNGEAEREGMHGELGVASDGAQLQGDVNVEPGESVNGRDNGENIVNPDGKNLASEADDIVDGEEDDEEGEDLDEDEEEEEEEEEYGEGDDDEGDGDDDELLDKTVDIPGGEAAAGDGKEGENEEQKNDDVKTESLDGEAKDSVEENNDRVKDVAGTVSTEQVKGDNAGMPGYVKETAVEHNSETATATGDDIHGSTTVGLDDVTTIHGLDSSQTIIAEGTTIVEDYIQQASKVVILESSQITLPTRSIEATPTPEPVKSSASVDTAATLSPPVGPTPVIVAPSASTAREELMKIDDSEGRKAETTDVVEPEDDDDDELIDIQAEFKEVTGLPMKPPSIPGGKTLDAYVTPGFQTRRPLGNPDDATPPTVKETHETTSEKTTPDGVTPVPIDVEVAPPVGDVGATTEPDIQVAEEGDVDSTTQEGGSGWIIVSFAVNVLSFLEPILQALVNVVSTFIRCSFTTYECHIFKSTTHTIPSF